MLPSSRGDFAVEELILRDGTERDIVLTSAELQQMRQAPFSACRTQTVSASCGRAGSTLLLAFHAGRLLASLRPGDRIVVFSDDDALRSELGAHDALRFVSPRFYEVRVFCVSCECQQTTSSYSCAGAPSVLADPRARSRPCASSFLRRRLTSRWRR